MMPRPNSEDLRWRVIWIELLLKLIIGYFPDYRSGRRTSCDHFFDKIDYHGNSMTC